MDDLRYLQALPLNLKISLTKQRIREWVNHFGESGVYVSFSGGKDSTVLLDIARSMYPNIKAMFVDIPTQYPELRDFVATYENVDVVRPKIGFVEVCEKYGFPLISKEVSECVQGARKYLTRILNEQNALTDRQTDRQTVPYRYFFDKVTGTGKYQKKGSIPDVDIESLKNLVGGGYDRKYRRIRGIGEFTRRTETFTQGRSESTVSDNVGNVDERADDKGEYP